MSLFDIQLNRRIKRETVTDIVHRLEENGTFANEKRLDRPRPT